MKVLLVDDAQVNLTIYQRALRTVPEVECVAFVSSGEALAWSARSRADLVLLDYQMPAPDGLEFIARFRGIAGNAETPIVMITAQRDRELRYRALELGANDFLTKPVDPIELAVRTRNMLALADSRRKLSDQAAWLSDEVRRATANIRKRELETIHRLLLAAECRDNETGTHIVRMGHICAALGRGLGLSEDQVDMLLLAAPMHDIGKIATPDYILLKPGKLTPEEWTVMKQHTTAGYDILKGSDSPVLQSAAEIALGHHEKFDGTGYPRGVAGQDIPLFARICAVSDVYDALTSERPYKHAWLADDAAHYVLARSGTQFDPRVIASFTHVLPDICKIKAQFADAPEPAAPLAA